MLGPPVFPQLALMAPDAGSGLVCAFPFFPRPPPRRGWCSFCRGSTRPPPRRSLLDDFSVKNSHEGDSLLPPPASAGYRRGRYPLGDTPLRGARTPADDSRNFSKESPPFVIVDATTCRAGFATTLDNEDRHSLLEFSRTIPGGPLPPAEIGRPQVCRLESSFRDGQDFFSRAVLGLDEMLSYSRWREAQIDPFSSCAAWFTLDDDLPAPSGGRPPSKTGSHATPSVRHEAFAKHECFSDHGTSSCLSLRTLMGFFRQLIARLSAV